MSIDNRLYNASQEYDIRHDPSLMWMVWASVAIGFAVLTVLGLM